jgi:hypothetical protein
MLIACKAASPTVDGDRRGGKDTELPNLRNLTPVAAALMTVMAPLVAMPLEMTEIPTASVPIPPASSIVATAPAAIVGQDNAARRCGHT